MKVTVRTPESARLAGFVIASLPNAYVVCAPDGAYYYQSFEAAKAFAFSYVDAGIVETVCFL